METKIPICELSRFKEKLCPNNVILITGTTPGSGSTSLALALGRRLNYPVINIGEEVRRRLNVLNEEDLQEKLPKIQELEVLDREIFASLPSGGVIVEGKNCFLSAERFVENRPKVKIALCANPVVAAWRVFKREGGEFFSFITDPDKLLLYLRNISNRIQSYQELFGFDADLTVQRADFLIDTGKFTIDEIVASLIGDSLNSDKEFDNLLEYSFALNDLIIRLFSSPNIRLDPRERVHIEENLERLRYQITERFNVISSTSEGLELMRREIRKIIANLIYPIYRITPKFYTDETGQLIIDNNSKSWTPEYYKLARAWPLLKQKLRGKRILDPFAGPGSMMFYVGLRELNSRLFLGDISYPGGRSLNNGKPLFYQPQYNLFLLESLFDKLFSFYRPDIQTAISGFITMDALMPPFPPNSFDIVFGDPPYGINLNDGGVDYFVELVKSLHPLAREGLIFIIPCGWLEKIRHHFPDFEITQVTNDLSLGESNIPTCFIEIIKK